MAPLIVITGPTASGKTGLALELAEKYNGEIICADSRTIYKGMDIGTAKPTAAEQMRVPHHMLDVAKPGQRYTAAEFQAAALSLINDIRTRGKVPFLVGGTGLYIDAVVREYKWPELPDQQSLRNTLEGSTITELHAMIKNQHLELPVNAQNKRHLISTIIRGGAQGKALTSPRENTFVVAIATEKEVLRKRIHERAEEMFRTGIVTETSRLGEQYKWGSEAMKSNIYPIVKRVIDGEINEHEAVRLFVTKDMQLAKRQVTWLKRHSYVTWLSLDEAGPYIETVLS